MRRGRRILAKLSSLIFRRRMENDLAREVASHLTLLEDDFQRRGMTRQEAKQAARRAYGSVEQAKELHRDERSFVWLDHAWQDLRHAYRSLAKSPGFVAVALLSLAFGIGVNTSIFTLVNGILLKKLPVPDPERIVQVQARLKNFDTSAFSFPVFRELRRQDAIFRDMIAFSPRQAILDIDGDPRKIRLSMVTGSYFSFFGERPVLGRLLNVEDDLVEDASAVCVLSYEAWHTHFGGDTRILDQTVRIDGIPLRVVGVAGEDFVGAELQRRFDAWVPTALHGRLYGSSREIPFAVWLRILARLKPGIPFEQADALLQTASPSVEESLPEKRTNREAVYYLRDASKGFDTWRSKLHDPLLILMGAVILVLLVACANLTNLLLARANERHQEFAIKLALGISRWRLLRQLLTETFLLAFVGGSLAILLAFGLTRFLLATFNDGNRYQTLEVEPDVNVFLFTLGGCVLTALIAGLYPAWRACRTNAGPGLKGASVSGVHRSLVRRVLIIVQVTLAIVLLFGASLFTHSLGKLRAIDIGFDIDRVLTVELERSGPRNQIKAVAGSPTLAEVLARVRGFPGVESAAFAYPSVLTGSMMGGGINVSDASDPRKIGDVHFMHAGTDYFSTLRLPLLRGRDFAASDRAGSPPVAIVNQQLASKAWPGEDPIGKRFGSWMNPGDIEVVGLVGDSKYQNVREEARSIVYLAFDQMPGTGGALQIRFRGGPSGVERQVREIVKSVAPDYQISNAATMELLRDSLISQERLLAFLSSLFGVLGAALALVGIYGLISYSVTRRTREVGIRMSVGAQRSHVLWLFLREAVMLLGGGVLLGLPLALALARLLEGLLYEVSTSDPVDMSIAVAVLVLGGLLASYIPGHRATRVNPVQALRHD